MTANTSIVGQGAEFLFHLVIEVKKTKNKTTVPMMSILLITTEVGTLLSQHSMRLPATFSSKTIGTARPIHFVLLSTENIWVRHQEINM